ncbi:MAG: TlpA family protein disulfide reductase [Acidobacteria bacterium]|nr:TlpA family protein disulfide reductase [Acidobacteriota bacterium]
MSLLMLLLLQVPFQQKQMKVDESAWAQLKPLLDQLHTQTQFAVSMKFTREDLGPITGSDDYQFRVSANKFALKPHESDKLSVYNDGEKLTRILPQAQQYQQIPAPADTVEAWLGNRSFQDQSLGFVAFMGLVFNGQDSETWRKDLLKLELAEGGPEDQVRVNLFKGGMDFFLEFTKDSPPILTKIDMPLRRYLKPSTKPRPEPRLYVDLKDWQWATPTDDSFFKATITADLRETEQFGQNQKHQPLEGELAPPFTLTDLNGQTFNPAEHKGKVIVLDFWATWCGPCRTIMPVISDLAKEYAQRKDIVIYSVNVREDQAKVSTYLKQQKLELPTLLDLEGTAQTDYKAKSIPQTVIIGKDGKVIKVHVGASPSFKYELKNEIEALLAQDAL